MLMSQTTKELSELMEKLPETVRQQIYHFAQKEAAKLNSAANGTQQVSLYEAAKKLGIVGILKDGPVDLSTNPKHMEGFGS